MPLFDRLLPMVPPRAGDQVDEYLEALGLLREIRDPGVLRALGPSGARGLVLKRGKQGVPTRFPARHEAYFDWSYPADHPELADLYRRAKAGQWDGETYLPWEIDVDPLSPEVPLLPRGFVRFDRLAEQGIHLSEEEQRRFIYSLASWFLSQFLHGEQGALMAAAQVTEAVELFDGKLFGATQVVDEGRHIEVFHRYLDTKLEKLYQINDNLYVIIDALMGDSRWDMKFLGMQIMIEGLALGAFGMMYRLTREPLLKELLRMVILDEARHVHYGVLALREHYREELSEGERREREEWAFEVCLLMRNRFMAYEVFEEWFEGRVPRRAWREFVLRTPGLEEFRRVMFSRLVPNLREIGLLSPRIQEDYDRVGLMRYFGGASADQMSGEELVAAIEREEGALAAG